MSAVIAACPHHGMVVSFFHVLMQVLVLVKFVIEFIVSNPFIVCSDELSFIKKQLHRDGDEIKVKQKTGVIQYKAYQGRLVYILYVELGVKYNMYNFRSL